MSMFSNRISVRHAVAAIATGLAMITTPALAQDAAQEAYDQIEAGLGALPGFIQMYPKAGVAGAWALQRDLVFGETSLDAKTKALISLAVAAQIPCTYCIYTDTQDALRAGATEEQIHEAVAISALTRHWSTIFNGYQIDLETLKKELGYVE
jgi:AhpD family alkylhydroperoxidase